MNVYTFLDKEQIFDGDTTNDFIRYVADVEEVEIDKVKDLDLEIEEWIALRDTFLI